MYDEGSYMYIATVYLCSDKLLINKTNNLIIIVKLLLL